MLNFHRPICARCCSPLQLIALRAASSASTTFPNAKTPFNPKKPGKSANKQQFKKPELAFRSTNSGSNAISDAKMPFKPKKPGKFTKKTQPKKPEPEMKPAEIRKEPIFEKVSSALKNTVNLPPTVLPSVLLLDKALRQYNEPGKQYLKLRDKLSRIIAEIDFLYTISTEVPAELTEDHWLDLLDTANASEREHYLRTIYYGRLVLKDQKSPIETSEHVRRQKEEKRAELDRIYQTGGMAYGPDFHQLFGADFAGMALQNRIDALHGLRMCQNLMLEPRERMPQLLIDCRLIHQHKIAHITTAAKRVQQLHLSNLESRTPFPITIANFLADNTVQRIVKRNWHFLYGYPSTTTAEASNDSPSPFVPHPFAPEVTNKGISHICARDGIGKDQIAYVSQRGNEYLPERLDRFRAFILLPFEDYEQPWLLPPNTVRVEGLPVYRLPLDQHIIDFYQDPLVRVRPNIPCGLIADILRAVFTGRMDWRGVAQFWANELTNIAYHVGLDQIDPEQLPFSRSIYIKKQDQRGEIIKKLEQYSDTLEQSKLKPTLATDEASKLKKAPTKEIFHAGRGNLSPALIVNRTRRYSREERNRRREEAERWQMMQEAES